MSNFTTSGSTTILPTCPYCNGIHAGVCPRVKAIEYHENGNVKRVEFLTPGDYMAPLHSSPFDKPLPPVTVTTTTWPDYATALVSPYTRETVTIS